jgi:hypothetical protein
MEAGDKFHLPPTVLYSELGELGEPHSHFNKRGQDIKTLTQRNAIDQGWGTRGLLGP